VKEPTTQRDVTDQKTGASAQFVALGFAVLVVLFAMFFWRPWLHNPPAAPLQITTHGPNAQPTTTTMPTP
jgi:hypothetical protein